MHLTLRAGTALPSLRCAQLRETIVPAIRRASNGRFRILAFSIQTDHLHAVVEADSSRALTAGISGFAIRVALAVNRRLSRKGAVWSDRYHARSLRTPRETRTAFLYVLQNWKKHVRGANGIDGCSSGPWFDSWDDHRTPSSKPIPVARPRTWLASTGWREHGGGPLWTNEAPARPGSAVVRKARRV